MRDNRALKTVKSGARIRTSESSLESSDNRLVPILSKKVEKKDMPSLAKLVDHGWTWVVRRTCGRISLADSRWRSTTPNDRLGAMLAPGRCYLPGKVRMACEPRLYSKYYYMSLIVKYFIINITSSKECLETSPIKYQMLSELSATYECYQWILLIALPGKV